MDNDLNVMVSVEVAEKMIGDGEYIHVMSNPAAGMFIGADWNRERLIEAFKKYGVGLSGPMATKAKHGLYFDDGNGYLFVETVPEPENRND